jgi:phage FluMu protein Com
MKFRCFQCNQLLGVSRSKAGSVVKCPKCSTDLIVPEPDEGPVSVDQPSAPETTAAFLSAIAAGLPVELAEVRLEDIRVDPESPRNPPPAPEPPPYVPPPAAVTAPPPVTPDPIAFAVTSSSPPPPIVEPVVPPITIAPPSLAPERMTASRARDLVLPRSVVASWSLFVLLAQALAFLAGLLAGHYIWRVH